MPPIANHSFQGTLREGVQMEPIRRGTLEDNIESATVTFIDTGEAYVLKTRAGSACHFFDRFSVGDDDIQLRLDWSDLDNSGQPMLDADFIDRETGKHRSVRGKRQSAHHTASTPGAGRCYMWEFDGAGRRFSVTVTWLASVTEELYLGDSCSADVIRAADRDPRHG